MRAGFARTGESRKSVRGATAVELALVLPIFLLLLFGIIDFGRYFFVQHTIQYATREGTRMALVGGTITDDEGIPLNRLESIREKIRDSASIAIDPSALSISIYRITPSYSDPSDWEDESAQTAGSGGDYMRVRTRYTYSFFTPLIGNFFSGGSNVIRAEATYRNEMFD